MLIQWKLNMVSFLMEGADADAILNVAGSPLRLLCFRFCGSDFSFCELTKNSNIEHVGASGACYGML